MRFKQGKRWKHILSRILLICFLALLSIWLLIPAVRGVTLVANFSHRSVENSSAQGLPVEDVSFTTSDHVRLSGWLAIASPDAPTIILVHGFKGTRLEVLSRALFLFHAGYNVLLFDNRGCGKSEGWAITLGAREPDDVLGAVQYLQQRRDLTNKQFGALGISLGAGVVLLAAAREPALKATVADSAWVDESAQLTRMDHLSFLPLVPYEPWLVDTLIGARLADTRPLAVIDQISPRAVMLIHSADDANTTTPLSGEQQLYQAAKNPKAEWIAPSGGHTGAINAHRAEYERYVLTFFATYIKA